MRRTPLYMALYAATLLLLGGCRKDLCYDHPDHAFSVQVNLTATWEQEWERSYQTDWQSVWNPAWPQRYDDLRPDVPTGIRARIYTGGTAENEGNLSPEGGRLYMNEGTHDLLFYNNDTEYIVFNDIAALPFGTPARSASTASASAEYGVCVAGLSTIVHPAASAGPALRVIIAAGKFHGVIAAHTPIGSLVTTMRLSGWWPGITSP